MSRTWAPITIDELRNKVSNFIDNEDFSYRTLTPTVDTDLSKVDFDTENITSADGSYSFGPDDLIGYNLLPNGMPYLGMAAGGDWETPVFFIIYWDGKKLRGYIPEDGNLYNVTTKCAYGNDEEADLKDCCKRWPDDFSDANGDASDMLDGLDHYDAKAIEDDIMARIVKKGAKPPVKAKKSTKVEVEIKHTKGLEAYTDEQLLSEIASRLAWRV